MATVAGPAEPGQGGWQSKEVFAFNGRWNQLPSVNIWPRPIQQPHPPVWIPASAAPRSTWRFAAQHDHSYCMLSFFGSQIGKGMKILEVMTSFNYLPGTVPGDPDAR